MQLLLENDALLTLILLSLPSRAAQKNVFRYSMDRPFIYNNDQTVRDQTRNVNGHNKTSAQNKVGS